MAEDWTQVVRREVADALGVDLSDLPENSRLDSTEGWDSLAQSIIIIRLEELTGKPIEDDEAMRLVSLELLLEFVHDRAGKE
jgi:acyl carrier protein